jgi:hypothetical protein
MATTSLQAADEDWRIILRLLPDDWERQAALSGAMERARGFRSAGELLRTLLLHVGKGYSLRETSVRARAAGLAEASDVALLNRLRKAESWWQWLCTSLATESGWAVRADPRGWRVRAVDGSVIHEPGRGGGLWRLHFSLQIPSLICDFIELTPARGKGTGEALGRFPVEAGDLVLADRGYSKPSGIEALSRRGAALIVRLNTASLPLHNADGSRFELLGHLRSMTDPVAVADWDVAVACGGRRVAGRLCVIRKSEQAAARERRRILRKTQQGGPQRRPETLEYAAWVMVFTTLARDEFSAAEVLEWYRQRWQIELVFKRLKSLARVGNLPKHDPRSARSWLYGKLLVALLCQKLRRFASAISPWGYPSR